MNINFNYHYDKDVQSTDTEDLKFQYELLREEILHNETIGMQLLGFALIIVAGGIGYVIKSSGTPLTKIATLSGIIVFLTLAVLQNLDKVRMTFLIAAYLRYYVEPKLNSVKWETRLFAFRNKNKKLGKSRYDNIVLTYATIALSNLLLMCIYTIKYSSELKQRLFPMILFSHQTTNYDLSVILILVCTIVCIGMWISVRRRFKFFVENNDEVKALWKEVEIAT